MRLIRAALLWLVVLGLLAGCTNPTPYARISSQPPSPSQPQSLAPSQGTPFSVPLNPSLSLSSMEEISLVQVGGVYQLPVELNGVLTLHFVLDSGAAEVNLPVDVVSTLVRTGTIKDADFLPGATYGLADGSELKSPRFLI